MNKMNAVLNVSGFADTLNKAVKLATTKTNNQFTECVSITADDSGLTFVASDTVTTVQFHVPSTALGEGAEIIEHGTVVVNGSMLDAALRRFPSPVSLKNVGEQLVISSGKTHFDMGTLDASAAKNWLVMSTCNLDYTLDAKAFKTALDTVIYAAAKAEVRPTLTGVHFVSDGEGNTIVEATDGLRMAFTKLYGVELPEFLVSAKVLKNLLNVLPDEGEIKIGLDGTAAALEFGLHRISIRLLDGTYPNTSKIREVTVKATMEISSDVIKQAIQRCLLIKHEQHLIRLHLKDGICTLDTQSTDGFSNHEELETVSYDGEISIGLNGEYLLAGVQNSNSDKTVKFIFNTANTPGKIVIPDSDEFHLFAPVLSR